MAELFGRCWTRQELREHVGDISADTFTLTPKEFFGEGYTGYVQISELELYGY